ncbi:MAG: DMT family transporter [Elainellaceae cyanobacterium]
MVQAKNSSPAAFQQQSNLVLGAGLMTLAFFMNTVQGSIAKVVREEIGGPQFALHIFSLALLILLPVVAWRRGRDFKTEVLPLHLLRGAAGGSGFLLFFSSVQLVELVNATVVLNTTPILIPLIAWVALGQDISQELWAAIAIGFVGLLVVVQPDASLFSEPGILLALAAAIAAAVEFLTVRRLNQSEPALTQVLYYLTVGMVLAFVVSVWNLRMPSTTTWLWLGGAAIAILSIQFALIRAFAYAEPHQVGVFQYTSVVFSAIIGWAFFNETPGWLVAVGIMLICVGGMTAVLLGDESE